MSFQTPDDIESSLKPGKPSVRTLYTIWKQRLPVATQKKSKRADAEATVPEAQIPWLQEDISIVTAFTREALKKEEFLLVCDAYREAIAYWQKMDNVRAGELLKLYSDYASAKTRLGFTRDARLGLEPLLDNPKMTRRDRAKINLQLGHILREESHHTPALAARKQTAEDARSFYQQAIALDPELLEGHVLNAAMSLILSEAGTEQRRSAEDLGQQVLGLIGKTENECGDAWPLGLFKAVAYAVMGKLDEATGQCVRLKDYEDITTADLAEARYRVQFLADALDQPQDYFKKAFPPLELIVFTGHNADLPEHPIRFPKESIPAVQELLRKQLDEMQARVGLVSGAAGADLLFIEALQARGASFHVILPWSEKEYLRTSVEPYDALHLKPFWAPLFEKALENSATVRELGQVFEPSDDVGWEYTQEVMAGLALLTARVSRLDVRPMALWDGKVGRGAGGTSSFVEFWRHYLDEPIILDLPATGSTQKDFRRMGSGRSERDSMHQEVKSMLFADIVGYSKLTEKVIRDFVEVFMQRLSNLLAKSPHAPRNVNTWGDAIYAVFDFAEDAGRFALELTQMIRDGESEWLQKGLFYEEFDAELGKMVKHPLNVRVGLHTGPVFAHYNPVLRQLGFTGSHVSRAARIEPVTVSGEVYASEEFAAMAELGERIRSCQARTGGGSAKGKDSDGFVCEYAGSMPLAKGYPGRFRIYRVIPHRVLAMEELAMAAHALYVEKRATDPDAPKDSPALLPWGQLSNDYKDANRAQVADLPNKLYFLSYELAPSHGLMPRDMVITAGQIEELAAREHVRWMTERERQGWVYGAVRDNARRHHPSIIPWEELSEGEKEKDRDTVVNLPTLIEKAGFRVRKIAR